jgi:phage terminase large subunit-like protein
MSSSESAIAGKLRAAWLPELEAELFAFPGSRYDDQCDSISQVLNDPQAQFLAEYIKAYNP